MTPEREAEIRAFAAAEMTATHPAGDYLAILLCDLLAAYDALTTGSALREARAEAAECRRRAGDAEERCAALERMLVNAPSVTEREQVRRERDAVRRALDDEQRAHEVTRERWQHAVADSDRWERAHDVLLADWREIDRLPAVHAAFVPGMKLSDAVAAALADVHYAEGTPLFDAEVAKREADAERDSAVEALDVMRERAERAEVEVACWRATGLALRPSGETRTAASAEHAVIGGTGPWVASQSAKGVPASEIAAHMVPSQPGVVAKLAEPPSLAAALSYSEGVQAERRRVVAMLRARARRERDEGRPMRSVTLEGVADVIEGGAT